MESLESLLTVSIISCWKIVICQATASRFERLDGLDPGSTLPGAFAIRCRFRGAFVFAHRAASRNFVGWSWAASATIERGLVPWVIDLSTVVLEL